MRFVLGPIPKSQFLIEEDGWNRCRELNPKFVAWFLGPVVALLVALVLLASILAFTEIRPEGFSFSIFLVVYILIVVFHEAIHAVVHPDRGLSEKTVLGFWPTRGIFFAHFEGSRSRTNFLMGIIAPFILLTVAPFILAVIFGWTSWIVGVVIVWNGLSSAIDLIGFFNVLVTVPMNTKVRNLGWLTYWLPRDPTPSGK